MNDVSPVPSRESLRVEFKSERSGPVDDSVIIANVVAFANTNGGTLYLGVEDDGTPTGVSREHGNITQLAAYVFNNTVPPVQVRPAVLNVDGLRVVAIDVDESSQLTCMRSGRVVHRVLKADGEPEVVTMYPYEFVSRLSSIGSYDYSAQPAPEGDLSDLDPRARDMLREGIARTHADDEMLSLSDADFDGALGLTTRQTRDGSVVPTIAGIVMIGTKQALVRRVPTATATFQVMRDGSPVVDERLRMPLVHMFKRIEELLTPWNPKTEIMLGSQHANFSAYDGSAFREIMANAFCHRDYTIMMPVRFQLDETGLTVANPGGFMRGVNLGNLLTVSPTPRNPRLADVMKRCGYVERTGRGIDRIFARTAASSRPLPDYSQSTSEEVVLFLRNAAVDESFVRLVDDATARRGSALPVESLITFATLHQYGALNATEIGRRTSLDRERVALALRDLSTLKMVSSHGDGTYGLADSGKRETNGTTSSSKSDRIIQIIRSLGGAASGPQIAEHYGKSYTTTLRLLKRMEAEGLVHHRGSTKASEYYI
ncbi:putative DNA binding domain-containing protein [Bifidobacterium amazonense]|uniref:DNA binding domain-containing protein n=1 Tax=Bifidobacterium amazonense TaxID=2809027 RepID=A0ABS9VVQ2_9BIFI|nr:RNA-binding domain-containing protein [Bifidobacterium amazonense]MCH9276195.1 putative DNA binding domain-containing protein [Bifidobacterium amazonense]